MRLLQSSCLFLAVLIVTPTFAWGQDQFYDAYLLATHDGTAMQLLLSLGQRNFGPGTTRGNAVAFDVFRSTMGHECGPEERVTDQPIAWPVVQGPGNFEVSFTDPNVIPNTAYRYEARPVDAARSPAQGMLVSSVWGYGIVGVALLGHGELIPFDNFTVYVHTCQSECFPDGLVVGTSLMQLGTTVILYGNRVGLTSQSNLWYPEFFATSANQAPCLVAVEPVGWSALKSLYK